MPKHDQKRLGNLSHSRPNGGNIWGNPFLSAIDDDFRVLDLLLELAFGKNIVN